MFVEAAIGTAVASGSADATGTANHILTACRSGQIADFLEDYWRRGHALGDLQLGQPDATERTAHRDVARGGLLDAPDILADALGLAELLGWHHLIYSFMLEQTRMYDIFRRVVQEYVHGERLPRASGPMLRWLRTTEDLFFSTPRTLTVRSVTSNLRPDDVAVRRNAYYRMFGMDLTHGAEDGRPYPYAKAEASNRDFVQLFEALLTEVWKGYTNRNNLNNVDETDDGAIATLVARLQEMLLARRLNGALSREEFDAVATMSWFRLAISSNNYVVNNLNAQAAGDADRLKQIGNLVGISAHSRTDAYLRIAQPISVILREIENGNIGANTTVLYLAPAYQQLMIDIITNWGIATGRDMKDASRSRVTLSTLTETTRSSQGNGTSIVAVPAGLRN